MATVNEKMTAIADAIREKTGGTDKLTLDNMAQGVGEVYDVGRQAQYDEFWDTVQSKGTRTWYECAFSGSSWTNANFKPKYDIHVEYGYNMFFRNRGITDLKALLKNAGVVLDFSNATDCYSLFALCYNMTHIPELNFTKWSQLNNTFNECRKLHTIDKIIIPNCTSIAGSPFYNCTSLANIVFEGVISANISLAHSPLTKSSITSVINALSDTVTGKTLTLKKTAVNTAFEIDVDDETTYPEGTEFYELRHSKDNWTFSYA